MLQAARWRPDAHTDQSISRPDVGATPTTIAALALTSIAGSSSAMQSDQSAVSAATAEEKPEGKPSKASAESRWKRKIEGGEPLLASAIGNLSLVAARQYLRAMNECHCVSHVL